MKLSRRFLVLAAALAAAPLAPADVTVNYASPQTNPAQVLVGAPVTGIVNLTNLSAPGTLPSPTQIQELARTITSLNLSLPVVGGAPRTQLILDQQVAATTQVKLLSADFTSTVTYPVTSLTISDVTPLFIKSGGGTLQYDAFKDINYFGNNTFTNNSSLPNDLRAQGAFSGIAIVQQGSLVVSGYLNQWAEYGGFGPAGFTSRMVGAKAVIVQGNSTLSFQNTPYNVVGVGPTLGDSQLGNPSTPLLYRLNFVHNLYAGTLQDFVTGANGTDVNTILDVGKDADYVLDAHFDAGMVGSIGRIDGAGRLYKSGTGQLAILNSSRLTGDVFIAGGDLVLNDPNGLALRQASSINLIGGSGIGQTTLSEFNQATDAALGVEWRPGYLPAGGSPVLAIRSNQTIRNLQALYSEITPNLWDAGPGSGSRIDVSANQRLIVIQDENLDGYYAGSVNGGQGIFEKQGVGALALMGTSSSIGEIDITAGKIIANVQSLGYGRVVLGAAGTLSIVQNNAGTLRAQINGAAGSVLTVAPSDAIVNTRSGGITIGNGQLGVIDVYNRQDLFYGNLVVQNGITLAFSFGQDNTFVNAASIVLSSGLGDAAVNNGLGYETTIRFNDTTQRVNNLVGDANTRIELGRGSITLNQNAATTYQGKVTGAGNLVKTGANTLTLAGLNSYYGATVVKQGTLALSGVDGIQNTAGLVLLAGTTLTAAGNQTVGALFGQAGSTINLAGGTLTVGKTTDQIAQLNAALTNFPGESPDANPAYYLQTTPTVDADITLPWGVAGTKTLSLVSVAGLSAGSPVTGVDPLKAVASGGFTIKPLGTGAALGNTVTMADVTGLSVGQTVGTIAIVKPINNSTAAGVLPATITVGNATDLAVGQTITGLGIPANTRINAINGNTLTLSAALTATSSGLLTVATGIPAGSTIAAINGNTLTLSNALTAQAAGSLTVSQPTLVVADATGLAVGQTVYSAPIRKSLVVGAINAGFVTVSDATGLAVGQMVTGVGIPTGTTITQINGNILTLSATTTAATSGTLTVLTGIPTGATITQINGTTVTLSANLLAPGAGTLAIESGITPGSVITGINGNVLTLDTSLAYQAAGSLTNLPVAGMSRENTLGFLAGVLGEQVVKTVVAGAVGATTVTLADVAGLAVGRTIIGTGIPAGAKITAINGNVVTLDLALTAAAAGSVRVLTATDQQVLSFRGNITGTGGLTKIGPERLILGGVSTYSGATSIQGGILQVNWDALPNTSGIAIGALGSLAINVDSGSHSFDRPITGVGGFEKLGAGTLVINTTTGWSTGRIDILEGAVQFNPGDLPSITGGIVNVRAGTNFQLNTPRDFSWTGSISGAGDTSKTGAGTLTIGGTFTSTGTMSVQAGKVIVSALPADGADFGVINVAAGTTFADQVAATSGTQLAAGTIVPVASSAGFYVGQEVFGTGITPGSVVVAVSANSLTLDTPTTAVANGPVVGRESYGRWDIRLGSQAAAGTALTVGSTAGLRVGMRVFDNSVVGFAGLLGTIASIDDATHVTLSAATATALNGNVAFQQGDIKGAGNFEKSGGGSLELIVPLSLTGAVNLTGGGLDVRTEGAFASAASVNLGAGTTLNIAGYAQDLANMSGAATSTLLALGSTLTVNVATGLTTIYRGQVIGGTIEKSGAGTFNLARLGTANSIAAINIHAGTLIGSQAGFGTATLAVDDGATIGFNNDDPTAPWTYSGRVTSTGVGTGTAGGTILKTGAGQVELDHPGNTATNFVVQGGKLIVHDDRPNGSGATTAGWTDLATASIADGASFRIQLGNGTQRVLGAQIAGVTPTSTTQLELATTGTAWVGLAARPSVTSLNLLGGVSVRSTGQSDVVALAGDSAAEFVFTDSTGVLAPGAPAQAVTLHQAVSTTMLGEVYSFIDTNLTLVGAGRASFLKASFANNFLGSGAYGFNNTLAVGTTTEAGHVEILAAFGGKSLALARSSATLANQGSVAVRAVGGNLATPVLFDGTVTGVAAAGRFIKTGSGYLDGRTASVTAAVFSSYEIEEGHFVVQAANGSILDNRPITLKGGFLDIEQDSNPATLSTGSFAASSGNGVIEVHGSANSGLLTIAGNFAGGLQLSDQSKVALGTSLAPNVAIAGNITVDATSALKGSATLGTLTAPANLANAGVVAPGYSPGVITVTGNVTNSNLYQMELSATETNGTFNDRIEFYGTAALNEGNTGRVELSQFGVTPLPHGQRFVLFKGLTPATVATAGGVAGKSFLATATINGLKVGQGLAGTGLAAGVTVAAVIPQVALTATGGSGSDVLVADATGLVVGQVISGTGIAAGSVINAITGTTLTLNQPTTATPAGTLTAAAGVTLSAALTAAPAGTVAITASPLVSAYYTSATPLAASAFTMVGNADNPLPKPYLLSIPTAPIVGVPVAPNEIAVYSVRTAAEYAAFQGPAPLIGVIQSLTQVDMVRVGAGVDGIANNTDDVWRATPAATFNLLGSKLAVMGDAQLQNAIDNLTPFGAASVAALSIEGLRVTEDSLAKRLEMRRFDRSGLSIVQSEWFFNTDARQLKLGAAGEVQTKGNLTGVSAGLLRQSDDGVNVGFVLGGSHVTTSGDTSARFSGNDIRADVFAGGTFFNDLLSFDVGASVSHLSGSATRASIVAPGQTNTSSPAATTIGGWARLGTVLPLKAVGAYATPFLGVEVSSTKVSGLGEIGQADALQVSASAITQTALRAGLGFHKQWESEDGTWRYRLSTDLGYLKQGSGETSEFTATNNDAAALNGTSYTSPLRVTGGSGFYLAPSLSFGPNENTTYSLGLTYEKYQGTSTGLNFSYRKRF